MSEWRRWFAWYPVVAIDHRDWEKVPPIRWVWLCEVNWLHSLPGERPIYHAGMNPPQTTNVDP